MKVIINQELLANTLAAVNKAVSTRSVNALLTHVKLVAEPDSLTVTGTDGEFMVRRKVAITGAEEGRTMVPAKIFSDLVSRLPKKDITLALEDNQLSVSVGRIKYDITVMWDDSYPELPDYQEHNLLSIACGTLKQALEQTTFAAVKDSAGGAVHYTNSVLFRFNDGRLDIVATNGHRLALKKNSGINIGDVEKDLLMPVRIAGELERMLPDDEDEAVSVFHHNNQAFFQFGNQLVVSALMDMKFPLYERVIPQEFSAKIHINREEMADALGRVLLVCRQKDQNPVAYLETQGETVKFSSDGGELGKGIEELSCELSGPDLRIAINPQYIIEVLKVLAGEQVTLNWAKESSPVTITNPRDPEFTYIVMPINME